MYSKYFVIFVFIFGSFSTFSTLAKFDIQKDLPANYDLVTAGDKPVALLGHQVQIGSAAPNFKVVNDRYQTKTLNDYLGQPFLISVVASLDTGVCSIQTKRFNDALGELAQDIKIITISADLPFAQKRFCQQENIDKVETLSDSVWRDFGMNYGVLIKDMGLLTRAIFVVDTNGIITYKEIVPVLSDEPNYDMALTAISQLSEQHSETGVQEPEVTPETKPESTNEKINKSS